MLPRSIRKVANGGENEHESVAVRKIEHLLSFYKEGKWSRIFNS